MHTVATDVAVIGAGTAGLAAYRTVVARGRRAVLIERGAHGTTCARVGCMPSKLLIAPAEALHSLERFPTFGLVVDGAVKVDGRAVMARVRRERDRFVGFVTASVDALPLEDRLDGDARFVDDHTLQVGADTRVEADRIIIATGSSAVFPAAWKALGDRLLTNVELFEWDDLPQRVAVFGPGVIGLELGQALHRLGVDVAIYGRGGGVGPLRDPVLVAEARRVFGAELALDTDARAEVTRDGDEVVVTLRAANGVSAERRYDFLLAATGRRPNVHGLDLDATTLELDADGVPVFDRTTLRCGASSIYIAGDAGDDTPLLHEAADEGRIAGENAARHPDVGPGLRRAGLAIVFTDPQIAIVGGGYAAVRDVPHVTGAVSFENQGRARIMLQNHGRLHVYAEPGSGRFMGAEMLGPAAEHIGHLLAWARQCDLTVARMLTMPFYHPVVEEGLRTALRDAQARLERGDIAPPGTARIEALMA